MGNANAGIIDIAAGRQFVLSGASLSNRGTISLNTAGLSVSGVDGGPSQNYCLGRAESDITGWAEYFWVWQVFRETREPWPETCRTGHPPPRAPFSMPPLPDFLPRPYFCEGVADSFESVRERARAAAGVGAADHSGLLRRLDPRERRALKLFRESERITSRDVERLFGTLQRMARNVLRGWVKRGFLVVADAAKKSRRYGLAGEFGELVK